MIEFKCIDDVEDEKYDEVWWIVRSPKGIPETVKWVPELSPSVELFAKYREAYHAGEFGEKFFQEVYVPQFLDELSKDKNEIDLLNKLRDVSKNKNIALCCFCEDESLCHRSIIAGILLGLGANVDTKDEYLKYFNRIKDKLIY